MKNTLILVVGFVLALGLGWLVMQENEPQLAGVNVGNEYTATSTKEYYVTPTDRVIRRGWGTLGSITITGAGTTDFALFDATTTVNSIDGFSTSSKLLAHIPASTAAGTYTFDVQYTEGLVLHVITAGTGTSTITYR